MALFWNNIDYQLFSYFFFAKIIWYEDFSCWDILTGYNCGENDFRSEEKILLFVKEQ